MLKLTAALVLSALAAGAFLGYRQAALSCNAAQLRSEIERLQRDLSAADRVATLAQRQRESLAQRAATYQERIDALQQTLELQPIPDNCGLLGDAGYRWLQSIKAPVPPART